VGVRCRPLAAAEAAAGGRAVWSVAEERRAVVHEAGDGGGYAREFPFDHVYGASASTAAVFGAQGARVVDAVAAGMHGTVVAYGPPGGGKSFTMLGADDRDAGMVRLALAHLFARLHAAAAGSVEFLVRLSLVELAGEVLCDLLAPATAGGASGAAIMSSTAAAAAAAATASMSRLSLVGE